MFPPMRPKPIIASCIVARSAKACCGKRSTESITGIGLGDAVHTGLYVIMGVSGSGKTTVGAQLARALQLAFLEGDDLHPAQNVERMAAGIPLTDDDRRPWLLAIAGQLRDAKRAGVGLVVACSALKRRYRDLLR